MNRREEEENYSENTTTDEKLTFLAGTFEHLIPDDRGNGSARSELNSIRIIAEAAHDDRTIYRQMTLNECIALQSKNL